MKTSKLIFLLKVFHFAVSYGTIDFNSVVPYAISEVLKEHFAKFHSHIDLVYYETETASSKNLIDSIMRMKGSTVVKLLTGERSNEDKYMMQSPSIVIFESVKEFKKISRIIGWQASPTIRLQHLVYVPNITAREIEDVPEESFYDSVSFLVNETEKSIVLATPYMFTQRMCRSNQLVTINRFNSSMRWENTTFYPEKYRNFHGCRLKVLTNLRFKGRFGVKGLKREIVLVIIDEFARTSNFTIQYVQFVSKQNELFGNDLTAMSMEITGEQLVGHPFMSHTVVFFIPPGEPYTDLEKMFLPFQYEFWVAIAIALAIGFAVIQVINFTSTKVQNFVFGTGNRTPSMNLVSIFLTGSQCNMPGRNFARFLLMLFVFWSLVVRTCNQSELFKYLQADLRKPIIETIDQMFEKNLTLLDNLHSAKSLKSTLTKYPNA